MHSDDLWQGAYKIPWNDPDFSRRMLKEHLSQEHDLASRRLEWIDRQVEWLGETLLKGEPSRILDLGCGPGLYSHRLSARGYRCLGIDFGPASIEYARAHAPDGASCEFVLGDIRSADFGGPCDLVMLLYGELNVFSPSEAADILRRARKALAPNGRIVVEMQRPEAVEAMGHGASSDQELPSGLFSDRPHCLHIESRWLPEACTTVQTFRVTEEGRTEPCIYRSTTRAWSDSDLAALFRSSGFQTPVLCSEWPSDNPGLALWRA